MDMEEKVKRSSGLKVKLIAAFTVVIAVMSAIAISTFLMLRASMTKLDTMTEVVILANDISTLAGTPTVGMPKDVEWYSLNPSEENAKVVMKPLNTMKDRINVLKGFVTDRSGAASLLSLENMAASTEESFNQLKEKLKDKAPFSEVNDVTNTIKDTSLFISDGVRELIAVELDQDKAIKGRLQREADIAGIFIVGLIVLFGVGGIMAAVLYSGNLVRPIVNVADSLKNIAEGEADLTTKLEVSTRDEIGVLAKHFDAFVSTLNAMIKQIRAVVQNTKDVGAELAASAEQSTAALEEMTRTIESMTGKTSYLDEEISKSHRMAAEIREFVSGLERLMKGQSLAVDGSFGEIQGMLSSITKLVKDFEAKFEVSSRLMETAQAGEKMMRDTFGLIRKVSDSTSVIMNLLKVMNDTNRRTNILAMNASIEAAHAGAYGRGFAVVASEIRILAEGTDKSSKSVSKSLADLLGNMRTSQESTEKTASLFSNIISGVTDVSRTMVEMKNAMRELSTGSEKIIESLKSLVSVTEDVKKSYSQVNETILLLSKSLDRINLISNETKTGMEETSLGVGELYTSAKTISDAGARNVENTSELETLIEAFKVDE